MKRLLIMFAIGLIMLMPYKVYAADYQQQIDNLVDDYGITQEILTGITAEDIFLYIREKFVQSATRPMKISLKIGVIIIICAVVKVLNTDEKTTSHITDIVSTLIIFITLLSPVQEIIGIISENLYEIKNFMSAFLPVYAGISLASGEFITSGIYSGFFLTALIFISNLTINTVLPSVQLYFAMIISNALSPYIRLQSLCDFYIKSVKWLMRSIVSVICFVLTIQTTISQGNDTLAVKAGKVLAGSAIPVIGSVLQDAVGSVYAGMEAIKGYAGAAGVAGIVYIFMPSVILLTVYWFCVNCLGIFSDIFEMKSISACIKGFVNVIELMQSVIFLFMILLVFSLTIMISLTNGV